MAGQIKYLEADQIELVSAMKDIKTSLKSVKKSIKDTKSAIPENLEGEASKALIKALDAKASKINLESENWETLIKNAKDIEKLLLKTDKQLKTLIEKQGTVSSK